MEASHQKGGFLENFFNLKKHNTTVRAEAIGGITTFLTMAYILFVNPSILGDAGMDKGALFTVTCVAALIGTLLAAFWARVPFAMAPGMGLNAFFTYALVIGRGLPWETALGIVFVSGVTFILLTVLGVREKIVNAIPLSLRLATSAGIGLFITFIGFKGMGLVVSNPATLVSLGHLGTPTIIALLGLVFIVVLETMKVRGGILIGIVVMTIVGMFAGEVALPESIISVPPSITPIAFKLDIMSALDLAFIAPIFSFMFVDLFDSVGTIVACSYEAKMVDSKGNIPKIGRILEADSVATVIGSLLGTSTTTTYIESASGISQGARTGLASVFTAALFAIALLFSPVVTIVPAFATAPALVMVGIYMFKNIKEIKFDDLVEGAPAFLTIILMPLTYSISNGLTFGFLSYLIIAICTGQVGRISKVMWVIGLLSAINLYISAIS
ncbi:NCS2 family permease [Flammeovirga aprica]|uniref:NCS2 family permease n=1 Tax=Flammeovirga aprica JL-4 TaxID=694437 RepID=A0A7X9P0U7_9BACT|nr:NCS2 family permease [Flammeovirga aprica]NME67433.1 NCS2 family permease [Flammeovirga aprica JL-4]